ncbi:hypothetical protein Q7P37_000204 [Cladosporium fusiforme]
MDPVGTISLVYEVSKDLYTYYRAVKECDTDIEELRTKLLSLQQISSHLIKTLKRDGMKAEDQSSVDSTIIECAKATGELKCTLDNIKRDTAEPQSALDKLKSAGRKAVYPFKNSTIAGLTEHVKTCQDALQYAISVLQLNVGATTIEQLQKVDAKLVAGEASLEAALQDLKLSNETATDEIVQHLLQQRMMLKNAKALEKAEAILKTLVYPEMHNRRHQIPDAHDDSLGWLFTEECNKYPELMDLLTFLNEENGLFWVQGKPASGKSTFLKYLLNRTRGLDKLWEWMGAREVVFVSHFCWIAGSTMQKSQQGLLQSLLHQVLGTNMALVPIACSSRWAADAGHTSWYEKELWDSLFDAVAASDKRICFFIDGLDEVEPERCHVKIAKNILKLSTYENVKVIASSRPWSDFEDAFQTPGKVLTLEKVNRLSIVNYVRAEMNANDRGQTFSLVNWECLQEQWDRLRSHHTHERAHVFVERLVTRADGVFLWIQLIMDALCKHLAWRCPITVLEGYVDSFPSELEHYFREMIFKRIHSSLISETAMALLIALQGHAPLSSFALLCEYSDSGSSCLIDPDFVSNVPCSTCTLAELKDTIRETMNFLRTCCRDLLNCKSLQEYFDQCSDQGMSYMFRTRSIDFTHRTLYDFLHTADMQLLLAKHAPEHFMNESLAPQLAVASWNMSVVGVYDNLDVNSIWRELGEWSHEINKRPTRKYRETLRAVEEAALHHFNGVEEAPSTSGQRFADSYRVCVDVAGLSLELARGGLYSFTDSLVEITPYLLSYTDHLPYLLFRSSWFTVRDEKRTAILRKSLEAGVDPNRPFPETKDHITLWLSFLHHAIPNQTAASSEGSDRVSAIDPAEAPEGFSEIRKICVDKDTQETIRLFIHCGADLKSETVAMLSAHLPMTTDSGWPELLHTTPHGETP